jgi:hypothetical protein
VTGKESAQSRASKYGLTIIGKRLRQQRRKSLERPKKGVFISRVYNPEIDAALCGSPVSHLHSLRFDRWVSGLNHIPHPSQP